ncbi:methylenetetrahydrofolate reductase [uncultured Rhodospira sp.]|uniref:methylenetetrahydrofolate reductase n=1 Tax=uncultured Rhodospira sp. TaxID=1936189 RepID=UPI0026343D4B|nr:methylenetetrahydrofolate reductase [uncultured Rhodospira sp.]
MPYDSHHHRAPAGFSIEITPAAARKVPTFTGLLPAGTAVYVTNLPGTDAAEATALCRRLRDEGMRPVPHLAARGLTSRADLAAWLDRAVGEGGAREILLIAGSGERAAGPFRDTLAVLDTGLLEMAGLRGFGVAGHPEGHPNAKPVVLLDALRRKQAFAAAHGLDAWIVTQFTFSAAPVRRWAAHMADAGVTLPIRVGLPGPAKPATLINYARQCGVGASLRVLTRRPDVMAGLVRAWTPDGIVADLTRQGQWAGRGGFAGLHLFPFGGFAKTAAWAVTAMDTPGAIGSNAGGEVVGLT